MDGFTGKSYHTFQGLTSILLKLFQNFSRREDPHPSSLYKARIVLIPKPDKDLTMEEYYRPISLMDVDAEILNKILTS